MPVPKKMIFGTNKTQLMKKILFCFASFTIYTFALAQITDVDAKLQFQQISEAYEVTDYYKAAKLSEDLKNKMGKWMPKVLYIYLLSAYKNYTEKEQIASGKYEESYPNFIGFKILADSFFLIIDKSTYPQDKYKDMLNAQQYFSAMTKKNEYQTTRTLAKAINFLNDCASKFPSKKIGNGTWTDNSQPEFKVQDFMASKDADTYTNFRIDSPYLRVVVVVKKPGSAKRFNEVIIWNDMIDLYHKPYIDENKTMNDDRVYLFLKHYGDFKRDLSFDSKDTSNGSRTLINKMILLTH
jgi:hypothetical protein